MDPTFLVELAKQSPGLAALVFLVWTNNRMNRRIVRSLRSINRDLRRLGREIHELRSASAEDVRPKETPAAGG